MIIEIHNDIKSVKEKEELKKDLYLYTEVLDKDIIRYLDGLIDLDLTVVREDISSEARRILAKLDIYKDVSTYNIYNRTRNILKDYFNNQSLSYVIRGNEKNIEGLNAYLRLNTGDFKVFNFDYSKDINDIVLSKMHGYTDKEKDLELCRIFKELEYLYEESNPFSASLSDDFYGGPSSHWEYEHSKKIKEYETMFAELDMRKLTDAAKEDIEITEKVYNYLLSDFGLEESDFKKSIDNGKKSYVKSIPGIRIRKDIKNI